MSRGRGRFQNGAGAEGGRVSVADQPVMKRRRTGRYRPIRVALLGYGRVGQAVAALAEGRRADLIAAGIDVEVRRALVRDLAKPRFGPRLPLTAAPAGLLDDVDVAIEAMGGIEPARSLLAAALERGVAVVTANKSVVAAHGPMLRAQARAHKTPLACDAAVIAGVPFLGALARRPLLARARRLDGVLNGTSHFVLNQIARGAAFDDALRTAVARGFAEPDARADIDGRDAAEKLTILLHLCGAAGIAVADVPRRGIEAIDAVDMIGASRLGGTIKPVALAALERASSAAAWVGPAIVSADHPLARLDGVDNALSITGRDGERVTFAGPGAGPAITAATLLDDLVEVTTGRGGFSHEVTPRTLPPRLEPPAGSWCLRVRPAFGVDAADVGEAIARRGPAVTQVVRTGDRMYFGIAQASWPAVAGAIDAFTARGWQPLALPVIAAHMED